MSSIPSPDLDYHALAQDIKAWARELGFADAGITDTDLSSDEPKLLRWLQRGFHGEMHFMARHGLKRCRPGQLVPGTLRIISVRMNYLPPGYPPRVNPQQPGQAFIARYAVGRDYHRLMRRRLQQLAERIEAAVGPFGYRAFVDSAPVLEVSLARKAGLGCVGKNTLLLHHRSGSYFFLGELFTDLPLPVDPPNTQNLCGTCRACLKACPTGAIVGPYQLDARRCIAYLTIELEGSIPTELRPLIGNRVFGCDECQVSCPWNRFARVTAEPDFHPRRQLHQAELVELFLWSEETFLARTEGSAIRRLGHERWLRNVAVALGNCEPSAAAIAALEQRLQHPSELVREHVQWALARLAAKRAQSSPRQAR
ncbi:MAG: tRNA epoxyqueuosine(34) reductase QueG [Xanthomonadaceae bacterium]|nr:tRNA epoxyqueuosine(34) reductase QueG [Xanthomonadaceae bacterium]